MADHQESKPSNDAPETTSGAAADAVLQQAVKHFPGVEWRRNAAGLWRGESGNVVLWVEERYGVWVVTAYHLGEVAARSGTVGVPASRRYITDTRGATPDEALGKARQWVDALRGDLDAAVSSPTSRCTSLTARWCPRCGTCACEEYSTDLDEESCPLHGIGSDHADAHVEAALQSTAREFSEAKQDATLRDLRAGIAHELTRLRREGTLKAAGDGASLETLAEQIPRLVEIGRKAREGTS